MSTRIISFTLISAVLLASYSSAMAADIRPEVAQPLDKARVLANGWGDKAAIIAKLNQAASVPNLSRDEQEQIRAITIYALARAGNGNGDFTNWGSVSEPPPAVGYTGLH